MILILEPHLDFKKLNEVTLEETYGTYGIYVLWHGRSKTRPSYIGQGDVLERFGKQTEKPEMSWPINGYIAIIGGQHRKTNKKHAELAEAILLDCADLIDKWPNLNVKRGKWTLVKKVFERYNKIRMYIKGYNPFLHPAGNNIKWNNERLVQFDDSYEYSSFPWKMRHQRTTDYTRI